VGVNCMIRIFSTTYVRNMFRSDKYLLSYAHVTLLISAAMNVYPHVRCPVLLSDFKQNWNIWTNRSAMSQYRASWQSVQPIWSCDTRTDRHCEDNRRIFAIIRCKKRQKASIPVTIRIKNCTFYWSRGSSVSIVSDYGLDDRRSIPDRGRGFFF
jgi:hypothetical protein